jgi:hypothetical protein
LIDSIKLDSTLLGVTEDSVHAWKILDPVIGLNSSYGWNKRTWAREAAIFPAEHPQVYRILVSTFARFNPMWKEPYKVGIQLYECKVNIITIYNKFIGKISFKQSYIFCTCRCTTFQFITQIGRE